MEEVIAKLDGTEPNQEKSRLKGGNIIIPPARLTVYILIPYKISYCRWQGNNFNTYGSLWVICISNHRKILFVFPVSILLDWITLSDLSKLFISFHKWFRL